jgi:NCAIR mutase (PurE)-related protein
MPWCCCSNLDAANNRPAELLSFSTPESPAPELESLGPSATTGEELASAGNGDGTAASAPPIAVDLDICLDLERRHRIGLVEAIWGEHKSDTQIVRILEAFHAAGELALVTRIAAVRVATLRQLTSLPFEHHADARCLTLPAPPPADERHGLVAVVAAGSSDLQVASEAQLALACHGVATEMLLDVGVAGLHRLLSRLEQLRRARLLIVCAGMEGALPTVLAGLLPQPVIGVPVSVGYGVSAGGEAALRGMLASCAPGLTVVNIDNGYGAAMAALRILSQRC